MDRLRADLRERHIEYDVFRFRGRVRQARGKVERAFRQARRSARETRQRRTVFQRAEILPGRCGLRTVPAALYLHGQAASARRDRKSTRLNSSHLVISYAVFCLKKKTKKPVIS